MQRNPICLALFILVLGASGALAAEPAKPACALHTIAELPVTMAGMRPLVTVKINGQNARFLVSSGAEYSLISLEAATRLGLKITKAPRDLELRGAGGTETPRIATIEDFALGAIAKTQVEFLTTESSSFDSNLAGVIGAIGQNFLEISDVEYDLANGVVRLLEPTKGCGNDPRVYWSQTYAVMDLDPVSPLSLLTGDVKVNGHRLRAVFSTGGGGGVSIVNLATAYSIGIKPPSRDVKFSGNIGGAGARRVDAWTAPIDSFAIGGEVIQKTRLRFGDVNLVGQAQMLIGSDFFLSHRIYVAKDQHKLYLTYNGGPVFRSDSPSPGAAPGAAAPQ